MRAIDVCAGAGGLSLGLQDAGFDVLGVERDDVAASFHRAHVGPCETADATTWSPGEPVDLVAGGVPCQPFSSAGARKGFDDVRGSLFVHLVRIAVEASAQAVLLENVVGLTNWRGGLALREIQRAYVEAGFGYVHWTVLNAADFGVPQHRRRVFIVGFRERVPFAWPTPTHGLTLWASAPWVSVREALGLRGRFDRGQVPWATSEHLTGMRMLDVDAPAVTVRAGDNQEHLARLEQPSPTICDGHDWLANASTRRSLVSALDGARILDRPSTTVQADPRVAPAGHHDRQQLGAVRLDPEQCAILQDFPRGLPWPSNKRDAHRLIGNAVPRRLGAAVGRAVHSALRASALEAA